MSVEIPVVHEKDSAKPVAVSEEIFDYPYKEPLVHQLVTTYRNNARAGTKAQKTRGEVRGGGRKPWPQKGTGRARAGSIRSPLWRGGGKVFAAKPRDFSQKLNKKMYRAGMRSILSELRRQNRFFVTADLLPEQPKTKLLLTRLREYGLDGQKILILVDQRNEVLDRAVRNIPGVQVNEAKRVDPVSLINADKVVAFSEAIAVLEDRFRERSR